MSTLEQVRQSIAQLIGEAALQYSERNGRLVITLSDLLEPNAVAQVGVNALASVVHDGDLHSYIAELQKAKTRAIRALGDIHDGTILCREKNSTIFRPSWQMIIRDASEPGKWRIQFFDEKGFSGHSVFDRKTDAIDAAISQGYTLRDDGALDRLFDTPKFQRGLYTTDLIGQVNMGRLTFEQANELLAKYDQLQSTLASVVSRGAQAFVAGNQQTMFLLADRIEPGTEGAVFLHEITHKWGKPMMDANSWLLLIGRLQSWATREKGTIERRIHDRSMIRLSLAHVRPHQRNEELFAYAVEEAVAMGVTPSATAHKESAQAWLDAVVKTLEQTLLAASTGHVNKSDSFINSTVHIDGFPQNAQQLVDLAYAMAQMESPERAGRIWARLNADQREQLEEIMRRQGMRPDIESVVQEQTKGQSAWYFNKLHSLIDAAPGRLSGARADQWLQWIDVNAPRLLSGQRDRDSLEIIGLKDLLMALSNKPVTTVQLREFVQAGGASFLLSEVPSVNFQCMDIALSGELSGILGAIGNTQTDIRTDAGTVARVWIEERRQPDGKNTLLVHEVATLNMGEGKAALELEAFELEMRTQYAEYLIASSNDMQGTQEGKLRFITRIAKSTDLQEILDLLDVNEQHETLKLEVAKENADSGKAGGSPLWAPLVAMTVKRLAAYAAANGFDELTFANPFTRFQTGLDTATDSMGMALTPTGITHDLAVDVARQLDTSKNDDHAGQFVVGWGSSADSLALGGSISAKLLSVLPAMAAPDEQIVEDQKTVLSATSSLDAPSNYSFSAEMPARWYFSQIERALMCAPKTLQSAPAKQWIQWLDANASRLGVKAQEIQWTGIREWLELMHSQGRKLDRIDLVEFARMNGVHVQDVKEDSKFEKYKPDGGSNYREVLLTFPERVSAVGWTALAYRDDAWHIFDEHGDLVGNFPAQDEQEAFELARQYRQMAPEQRRGRDFISQHWDARNVLAHVRIDDRFDERGRRVLMVHEIQSDWASSARDKSLKTPDAPFIKQPKEWVTLALKRLLAIAVEGNYQRISFATGEQVVDRFSTTSELSRIEFTVLPQDAGLDGGDPGLVPGRLRTFDDDGNIKKDSDVLTSELSQILGKAMTQALFKGFDPQGENSVDGIGRLQFVLEGEALKIASQGLGQLYDTIIPNAVNDLLKKLGASTSVSGSVLNESFVTVGESAGEQEWTVEFEDGSRHNSSWTDVSIARSIAKPDMGDKVVPAGHSGMYQPEFDITSSLREAVGKGLPLFSTNSRVLKTSEGTPLTVYRGETDDQEPQSNPSSFSFGTAKTVNRSINEKSIDQSPDGVAERIMAAHLVINNPLVNQPGDPFIEMAVLIRSLGLEKTLQIASRFHGVIQETGAWLEYGQGFSDLPTFLKARPQDVDLFCVDAYLLFEDSEIVGWLKEAGFDGAIHGGHVAVNGSIEANPKYLVFSPEQVLPVWSSGSIVDELTLTESDVLSQINAFLDYWQEHKDGPDAPYEDCVSLASQLVRDFARSKDVVAEFMPWSPYGAVTGIELTDLYAATPGQGAGSQVMNLLTEVAQRLSLAVYLRPDGERSRQFYARHGYQSNTSLNSASYGFLVKYPVFEDDDESDTDDDPDDEPPGSGGGPSGSVGSEPAMFSFAGQSANGADHASLHLAKAMISSNIDVNVVRQETGWFVGVDGKWRFEIDDSRSFLKGVGNFEEIVMKRHHALDKGAIPMYLEDILHHPALFAAYPHLAKLEVEFMPKGSSASGQLVGTDVIQIAERLPGELAISVLMHEIQHAIQYVEGFAIGGSSNNNAWLNMALRPVLLDASKNAMRNIKPPSYELYWGSERTTEGEAAYAEFLEEWRSPAYQSRLEIASQQGAPAQVYEKLAGEVESRDVQNRIKMSTKERNAVVPALLDEDKSSDVIVVFAGLNQELVASNALSAPKTLAEVRAIWNTLGIDHSIHERDGFITLSQIVVPYSKRNQGSGTQAMQALIAYADATGQLVGLSPATDFGATSKARLQSFYRRFGFTPNTGKSKDFTTRESMLRRPGVTSTPFFNFSLPKDGNVIRTYLVGHTEIAIDVNANTGDVLVTSVRTPVTKRGQGGARTALEMLIAQADEQGVNLKIHASASDSKTNQKKLELFYTSLGFADTNRTINMLGHPEMLRVASNVGNDLDDENQEKYKDISSVLLEIGSDKSIFQLPISNAMKVDEIAKSKGIKVSPIDKNTSDENIWLLCNTISEGPGIESWLLTLPSGRYATMTDDNGSIYINVSGVGDGNRGSRVYDLAANYAFNNKLKFIGDPNGLSASAMRRRLENMLSSSIKYGTTDFLEPHANQIRGDESIGVPPLIWTNGDTNANIRSMVAVSIAATERSNPIGATLEYDYISGDFKDASGERISAVEGFRAHANFDGRSKGSGQAGGATLRRNALFRSLLSSQRSRTGFVERLHRKRSQRSPNASEFPGLAGELQDIFYSYAAGADLAGVKAPAKTLHVQRGQHGSDVLRASNGEAGDGIYAFFPNNKAMLRYYTGNGERLWDIDLDASLVIDLTQPKNMVDLLHFAKAQFEELAGQMPGYVVPRVNARNIQRFGRIIDQYVRTRRPWARAWVVPHHGPNAPSGKQVVIADESVIVTANSRPSTSLSSSLSPSTFFSMGVSGVKKTFEAALQPFKKQIYHELITSSGCGPFDGGCVVFAQALQKIIGGEIVVLTRAGTGSAEHAAVFLDDKLYDFGGHSEPSAFCKRFSEDEFVEISGYRPMVDSDLPDASRDEVLRGRLIALLTDAFGNVFGNAAQSVEQVATSSFLNQKLDIDAEPLDWMQTLFGQPENVVSGNVDPVSFENLNLTVLAAEIKDFARDKQELIQQWTSRVYKSNTKTIMLEGDGPVRNGSISVSQANESRRRRMVESLTAQAAAATALAARIENGLNVGTELAGVYAAMERDIARDGVIPSVYPDQSAMFEAYISSMLLGDGNRSFGAGSLAGLIRGVWDAGQENSDDLKMHDDDAQVSYSMPVVNTDGVNLFQNRMLAAQELSDLVRSTGQRLKTNADGSVTLFHSTSSKNRDAILQDGAFNANTWFGSSKTSTMAHAKPKHGLDTVTIELRVDPRDVEFSTGTGEFYAPQGLRRTETGLWAPHSDRDAPAVDLALTQDAIGRGEEGDASWLVDEQGVPVVFYHGSYAKFDAFDMSKSVDGAHFFTTNSSHAGSFGPVREYHIKMLHPMEISQDDLDAAWDVEHPDGEQDERSLLPRNFVGQFVELARKDGYDGLIIRQMGDRDIQADMYLPLNAAQIVAVDDVSMSVAVPVKVSLKTDANGFSYNPELPAGVVNLDVPDVQMVAQRVRELEEMTSNQWAAGRAAVMEIIRTEVANMDGLNHLEPAQLTHIIKNMVSCQLGERGRFNAEKAPEFAPYRQAKDALSLEQKRYHQVVAENSGRPQRESMAQLGEFGRSLIGTEQFKDWFKRSQVVDDQGSPLIAFHGTAHDIHQFSHPDKDRAEKAATNGDWMGDLGNWFAAPSLDKTNYEDGSAEATADVFADQKGGKGGGVIYPVFLSIQNPMEFFDYEELTYARQTYASSVDMRQKLIAQGYDGIVIRDCSTDGNQFRDDWVSFFPSQIRGALSGFPFSNDGDVLMSVAVPSQAMGKQVSTLGLFSALRRQVAKLEMSGAPASSWNDRITGLIKKGLVKDSEVQWSGLTDWLALQTGRVMKDQVLGFLDANGVQVQETVLGSSAYKIVRIGSENYTILNANDEEVESGFLARSTAQEYIDSGAASSAKYAQYTEPGGNNYREVLLTLPFENTPPSYDQWKNRQLFLDESNDISVSKYDKEIGFYNSRGTYSVGKVFKSSHWAQPNVLAHLRVTDRVDSIGSRVLFVEELQSDWAQIGRREGFASTTQDEDRLIEVEKQIALARQYGEQYRVVQLSNARGEAEYGVFKGEGAQATHVISFSMEMIAKAKAHELNRQDAAPDMKALYEERDRLEHKRATKANTPSAPFVDSTTAWVSLALKRLITMAVDGGYDKVAFINGEQSVNRYALSKKISQVQYDPDRKLLKARGENDDKVLEKTINPEEIGELIGREMATSLLSSSINGRYHEIPGGQLRLGGEGMKAFYDSVIPSVARDVLRKLRGPKVQTFEVEREGEDAAGLQNGFVITDDLRDLVRQDGLPMFSFAGPAAKTALHEELDAARNRLADGVDANVIRQETGWFVGVDGKWRFEISDAKAVLEADLLSRKSLLLQKLDDMEMQGGVLLNFLRKAVASGTQTLEDASTQMRDMRQQIKSIRDEMESIVVSDSAKKVRVGCTYKLQDILSHPDLFAAYPELKQIQVRGVDGDPLDKFGLFEVGSGIVINAKLAQGDFLSVLLHEIQHIVQFIEKFAQGGDSRNVTPELMQIFRELREKSAISEYLKADQAYQNNKSPESKERFEAAVLTLEKTKLASTTESLYEDSYQLYLRLHGEVEARNVQARRTLDENQRRSLAPETTADTPIDEVIVVLNGQEMPSRKMSLESPLLDVAHKKSLCDIRMSFAGENALSADLAALNLAKATTDADGCDTWKAYGWVKGVDGMWRFEIDDSFAKVNVALIKSLQYGGAPDGLNLHKVVYKFDSYGTCELLLVPPNPQKVSDMIHLRAVPMDMVKDLLSQDLFERMLASEGGEDLIGDFEPAKMIDSPGLKLCPFNAMPLSMLLDHPALFAAYPVLKNAMVTVNPEQKQTAGLSFPSFDEPFVVTLRSVEYGEIHLRSMLLHEIQHAIQIIEGFALGGTEQSALAQQKKIQFQAIEQALARMQSMQECYPLTYEAYQAVNDNLYMLLSHHRISAFDANGEMRSLMDMTRELKAVQLPGQVQQRRVLIDEYTRCMDYELGQYGTHDYNQWVSAVQDLTDAQNQVLESPWALYHRLPGEVEARNVQTRMLYAVEQRRQIAPCETADVQANVETTSFPILALA